MRRGQLNFSCAWFDTCAGNVKDHLPIFGGGIRSRWSTLFYFFFFLKNKTIRKLFRNSTHIQRKLSYLWRSAHPANNALLINFLLSSDAEFFVDNHRLSMRIGAKHAKKTCMQRVHIPTELPFRMPPLVVGQVAQPSSTLFPPPAPAPAGSRRPTSPYLGKMAIASQLMQWRHHHHHPQESSKVVVFFLPLRPSLLRPEFLGVGFWFFFWAGAKGGNCLKCGRSSLGEDQNLTDLPHPAALKIRRNAKQFTDKK